MDAEWQPQTRTERCYLETMVTSQWLLARLAASEKKIYETIGVSERHFVMLAHVARQRTQLERSFRTAIADMKQFQKERRTRPQPQPVPAGQPTEPAPLPAKPDVPSPVT